MVVKVGEPWDDVTIVRKLPPLKYYHDLDISEWIHYVHGDMGVVCLVSLVGVVCCMCGL